MHEAIARENMLSLHDIVLYGRPAEPSQPTPFITWDLSSFTSKAIDIIQVHFVHLRHTLFPVYRILLWYCRLR